MTLLLLFAMLAGFATVLSPCILPVLPAILSVSAGGGKARPIGVILGLIASFVFFTLALTSLVHLFGVSANGLRYTAIAIIAFFGLVMIIPSLSNWFANLTGSIAGTGSKIEKFSQNRSGFISGLIVGTALGLVWTPCAGPILGSITTLVATQKVNSMAVLMTVAYAIGAAIPLFVIALGGQKLLHIPSIAKHTEGIRQLFGILMILTAIALYFNWETKFQQAVVNYLPEFKIEDKFDVQKQLQNLRSEKKTPISEEAPPIVGITEWINTQPLTLNDLKGKVVLIDFWTYSCINCLRTLPYLNKWYEDYKDRGFVILGVHTPEFEFEKDLNNVKRATEDLGIKYPVLMDNNYATWESYDNHYWPAHYLIDQQGKIVETHFGEGGYIETENLIRKLLGLNPLDNQEEPPMIIAIQTPETYLGSYRGHSYMQEITKGTSQIYSTKKLPESDRVDLKGAWTAESEYILSDSDESELYLNFKANRVYLVLGGHSSKPIEVYIDGVYKDQFKVEEPRKYDIIDLKGADGRHLLLLKVPKGIRAYAFTFGMEK